MQLLLLGVTATASHSKRCNVALQEDRCASKAVDSFIATLDLASAEEFASATAFASAAEVESVESVDVFQDLCSNKDSAAGRLIRGIWNLDARR